VDRRAGLGVELIDGLAADETYVASMPETRNQVDAARRSGMMRSVEWVSRCREGEGRCRSPTMRVTRQLALLRTRPGRAGQTPQHACHPSSGSLRQLSERTGGH
jgi:hypothetical protein